MRPRISCAILLIAAGMAWPFLWGIEDIKNEWRENVWNEFGPEVTRAKILDFLVYDIQTLLYVPIFIWPAAGCFLLLRPLLTKRPSRVKRLICTGLDAGLLGPAAGFILYTAGLICVNLARRIDPPSFSYAENDQSVAAQNYKNLQTMVRDIAAGKEHVSDSHQAVFDYVCSHPLAVPSSVARQITTDSGSWPWFLILESVRTISQTMPSSPSERLEYAKKTICFLQHYPPDSGFLIDHLVAVSAVDHLLDSFPLAMRRAERNDLRAVAADLDGIAARLTETFYPAMEYIVYYYWAYTNVAAHRNPILLRLLNEPNASAVALFEYYDRLGQLARRPYNEIGADFQELQTQYEMRHPWWRFGHPFVLQLRFSMFPKLTGALLKIYTAVAEIRAAQVAFLVLEYEQKTGRLPATPADLRKGLGVDAPHNPLNGLDFLIDTNTRRVYANRPTETKAKYSSVERPTAVYF